MKNRPEIFLNAAGIIERHARAETTRLKVVSVEESRQYALMARDRIAGYPVAGKPNNCSEMVFTARIL